MKSPQQLEGVLACPITRAVEYVNGRMVSAGGRSMPFRRCAHSGPAT